MEKIQLENFFISSWKIDYFDGTWLLLCDVLHDVIEMFFYSKTNHMISKKFFDDEIKVYDVSLNI